MQYRQNDIACFNSKHDELLEKYRNLIMAIKSKTDKLIIVGTIPRFGIRLHLGVMLRMKLKPIFLSKKFKKLYINMNIKFRNLWEHFFDWSFSI